MPLSLGVLQDLWGPPLGGMLSQEQASQPLEAIGTDSRLTSAGDLFVPLVGTSVDGHQFLEAVIEAGCRAVVADPGRCGPERCERLVAAAGSGGCQLWWVEDTQLAYQQVANRWRQWLGVPVVAVTGSAGKTTTRELIRAVLAPLGPVLASSGNENNDIGVPLTLLKASPEHRALVVEMGMRGLGEIERLSRCAAPDVAVITNIGTAHIGRLGSREAIATAKCEITACLRPDGLVVIPAGDSRLEQALASVWRGRIRRVALADDPVAAGLPPADLLGALTDPLGPEPGVLELPGAVHLPLPLPGRHNARNLLLALAVASELGLDPAECGPLAVALPAGRSRRLEIGAVTVLDETYNASPEAVLASLELLSREAVSAGGRRFAVLGTMLELGEQSLELHRLVARRAVDLGLDGLVVVDAGEEGTAMLAAATGIGALQRVGDPIEAAAVLAAWLRPGDVLLLKASRGVALERVIPLLDARGLERASPAG